MRTKTKKFFVLAMSAMIVLMAGTLAWGAVTIDSSSFPDSNFRTYVSSNFDTNSDGTLSDAELAAVTNIDVRSSDITTLSGIKYFTAVLYLYCQDNKLTDLDVSGLASMRILECYGNQITSLNVSGCTYLQYLYCNNNQLTDLDTSGLTYLQNLSGNNNQLSTLNVSGCTALQTLAIENNKLTTLDVSGLTALQYLNCEDNQLVTLDTSGNTALLTVNCTNNQISTLNVSGCTSLQTLYCNNNQLSTLDVSGLTALQQLNCFDNQLTSLNVSSLMALQYLNCESNQIATLNVNGCTALGTLICRYNQLTNLDISTCTSMTILNCEENSITDLNFNNGDAMRYLCFYNNQITDVDLSTNPSLLRLYCTGNPLNGLDVSNNLSLDIIYCEYNELVSLDVSKNAELVELYCRGNHFAELDLSNNPLLTAVSCDNQAFDTDSLDATGDSSYPYEMNLNTLKSSLGISADVSDFIARVNSLDIQDSSGNTVDHTTNSSTGIISFAAWPKTIAYQYDTKNSGDTVYMDVTVTVTGDAPSPPMTSDDIELNSTNFPDSVFLDIVRTSFDTGNKGYLSKTEREAVTEFNVYEMGITDLKGIEYFTNITYLNCASNDLTELDVSALTVLETLICYHNQLTELDVTQNAALTQLYCRDNQITSLDVTPNTELLELNCGDNKLTSLDVTHNTKLLELDCGGNQLSELDVSQNTELQYLNFGGNQLTDIDVSHNTKLTNIYCVGNQLTNLDVTKNASLEHLSCSGNPLGAIDVSQNIYLLRLECAYNQLTSLDVTNNPDLVTLYCYGNQLTELDLSSNPALEWFDCDSNQLTELNLHNNPELRGLYCSYNQLTELDLTSNSGLMSLYCEHNQLTELNVSNMNLYTLGCGYNPLKGIDVSNSTNLSHFRCDSIDMTALNVSKNTNLRELDCSENRLTELDTSNNTNLLLLICSGNQIRQLDVSKNISLLHLICDENKIHALDLQANTVLDSEDLSISQLGWWYQDSDGIRHMTYASSFKSQDVGIPDAVSSSNASFDYQLDLNTLELGQTLSDFMSRIQGYDVQDSGGNYISSSYDVSSGILYFTAKPKTITYYYDTHYSGYLSGDAVSMDVTVNLGSPDLGLSISPSTLTFTLPSFSAQTVTLTPRYAQGTVSYTSSVSWVTISGNTATVNPPAEAGTYTAIITATDSGRTENSTITATLKVTVEAGGSPVPPTPIDPDPDPDPDPEPDNTGITGISITSPASKVIAFDFNGGSFDASITALGTVSGSVVWSVSYDSGLEVSFTEDGSTASISGSAPANETSDDVTYNVYISAHDSRDITFTETLIVRVYTASLPIEPGITGIEITTPETKSITLESSGGDFTAIIAASGRVSGSITWSVSESSGLDVSLEKGDGNTALLSGTAPENTNSVNMTYSIVISARDDLNVPFTDTLNVTVQAPVAPPDDTGITGIRITSPSDKRITLESSGGTFEASLAASGTASGSVRWSISDNAGLTVRVTESGTTASLTGRAPENTSSTSTTYSIVISAHDNRNRPFTDTLTVIVRSSASERNPYDPDHPEWDGNSEANAWRLNTPELFTSMIGRINRGQDPAGKYYRIDVNMDITDQSDFEPIGTEENPFTGHFNGNSHTVTYVNARGLFGTISSDGSAVSGLNVVAAPGINSVMAGEGSEPSEPYGGIAAKLTSGTIENCTFSGTITASEGDNASAGGIVGELAGGSITNCRVLSGSRIYASSFAGGIAGYVSGGSITNCESNAEVATSESSGYSGGIAGYSEESAREGISDNTYPSDALEVGNDEPVPVPVPDDTGITGIRVTSPDSRLISLASSGGSFDAIITASGTPSGDISWEISFDSAVSASLRPNGNIAMVSGRAPRNTNSYTLLYYVRVSAHDNRNVPYTDEFRIEIAAAASSDPVPVPIPIDDIPSPVRNGVASHFSGISESDVYYLTEGEYTYAWDVSSSDLAIISQRNEQIVFKLPRFTADRNGVYVIPCRLDDASVGARLKLYGIIDGTGRSVSASALENLEYTFFDENGNEIDTVPANRVVYAALRLTAGTTRGGVITVPAELKTGIIVPVSPEEVTVNVIEQIAEVMSIDTSEIKFITEAYIDEPTEPTDAMKQEARRGNEEFVGKLNTVTVPESGYYVMQVTLTDELYEQLKGLPVSQLRVRAWPEGYGTATGSVSGAAVPILGFLNTWELFELTGQKMETTLQTFLMVVLLDGGEPFSLFLLKTLLMLLGGCDAGLGLGGLAVAVGTGLFVMYRRRRR